jgi:hypothetical protein
MRWQRATRINKTSTGAQHKGTDALAKLFCLCAEFTSSE